MGSAQVNSESVVDEHPDIIIAAEGELHTGAINEVGMRLKAEVLISLALYAQNPLDQIVGL